MKTFIPSIYSKNMQYCALIYQKPNALIYKVNFNLWCVIFLYQRKYSIQIFNPKINIREPLNFKWTKEQTATIIQNLIKRESINGKYQVVKSLATR